MYDVDYTREPEANVKTYHLGHYEQMQISIALHEAMDAINANPDTDSLLDVRCIRSLLHVFQPFGTLTLIRTVDPA